MNIDKLAEYRRIVISELASSEDGLVFHFPLDGRAVQTKVYRSLT